MSIFKATVIEVQRLIKEGLEKESTSKTFVSHLVASWWEKCNWLLAVTLRFLFKKALTGQVDAKES